MKRIAALALLGLLTFGPAEAQVVSWPPPAGTIAELCVYNSSPPTLTPSGSPAYLQCDSTGSLRVNASVSASISGFPTIQSTGTPISVTSSGVTGTLPTGTVVVASNVGATNGAYCKLGASATTSDQLIPPNSWFAFTVGANTQLTCITSTSTTTVNMVGGSGLPTGSGGGGGGSGSSGAVFGPTANGSPAANPPVLMGGTSNGTATGNVGNAKIDSSGTQFFDCSTAGNTLCGLINTPSPLGTTTGGWTPVLLAGLTSTPIAIKTSAGWVGKVYCMNGTGATAYIQVFDTTPITIGTTKPKHSYGVPAGQAGGFIMPVQGDQHLNNIAAASTTTVTGGTSATMDCDVSFN